MPQQLTSSSLFSFHHISTWRYHRNNHPIFLHLRQMQCNTDDRFGWRHRVLVRFRWLSMILWLLLASDDEPKKTVQQKETVKHLPSWFAVENQTTGIEMDRPVTVTANRRWRKLLATAEGRHGNSADQQQNAPHNRHPPRIKGDSLADRQSLPDNPWTIFVIFFTKIGPSPSRKLYGISASQITLAMSCISFNKKPTIRWD